MPEKLKRFLTSFGVLALVGLVFLGSTILQSAGIGERSFTLEEIAVDAEVGSNRAMQVTERVTYDFNGEFSVGTRTFDVPFAAPDGSVYEITDIQAETADGQSLDTVTDTTSLYEWELSPSGGKVDGRQEYVLTYTVQNAVTKFQDVGELEWKWIGSGYPAVDRFRATVTMPGNGEGLRAWGHGPLNGEVSEADGPTVSFTVDGVPQGQFVESRIVVPASNFEGPAIPRDELPSILEVEEADARIANQNRINAEAEANREDLLRGVLTIGLGLLIPLALLAFWLMWKRWGQEPPRPDDIGEYWREVPDDPPAVALALKHFGDVDATAYSATAVDLAQRGYLTITEEVKDGLLRDSTEYRFHRTDKAAEGLLPFESTLLAMLFRDGDREVTQTELQAWARSQQSTSQRLWQQFQGQVKSDLAARGYINRGRAAPFLLPILMAVVLGGLGVLALVVHAVIAGIAGLVAAATLLGLTILMRQRTPAGARRFAMWDGLERFLEDFSRLGDDDVRVADKVIYERYLVAAVALGVSDKLVEGMRLRVPEVAADTTFAPWYVGRSVGLADGGGIGRFSGIGSFSSHFGSSTAAFTPRSSGSGSGGGGFSGGGGGGGGGGGFGAR